MEILEFGDKSKRKIILIHGFQSPYQVWDKYIKHYSNVKVKCLKGRGHCELALLYPEMMIEELEKVL